jgi:hypothetical protein
MSEAIPFQATSGMATNEDRYGLTQHHLCRTRSGGRAELKLLPYGNRPHHSEHQMRGLLDAVLVEHLRDSSSNYGESQLAFSTHAAHWLVYCSTGRAAGVVMSSFGPNVERTRVHPGAHRPYHQEPTVMQKPDICAGSGDIIHSVLKRFAFAVARP